MEEKLDLSSLQSRINEIKKEGQESADFTIEYIECLMNRHDLKESIVEDYEIDGVPESILESLRKGEIPTRDEIMVMDSDTQNFLLFELIWLCGMLAISYYSSNEEIEEDEPSTFDVIMEMVNISPGHWTACYLIAILTLLMARIPSESMISKMTNDFSDDEEQIQLNLDYFIEFSSSLLFRHTEDIGYYD
jgi:hypothetical protein